MVNKMIEFIKKIFKKYHEVIMYLVFGVLSTIICVVSYYVLTITILNPDEPFQLQIANFLSWFITVLFVYFTNRKFVFISTEKNKVKEVSKFFLARIVTLLMDMIIMAFGVTFFHFNDKIVKIFSQVIVIVSNYFFSKVFVFKGKKELKLN